MKETHEIEPEELIRQVFLRQLVGDSLSSTEKTFLKIAFKSKSLRRMCNDLKVIYRSPEMLDLLQVNPTSNRFEEVVNKALLKSSGNQVSFFKRIISFFY